MKKIIIAIIILVAAFLVYNFAPTGYVTFDNDKTEIEITPEEINAGEKININLNPSSKGVNIMMTLHAKNHLREDTTDAWGHDCANAKRTSTAHKCMVPWEFEYKTPNSLKPGKYYLRFFDYKTKEYIKSDYFEVTE